MGDSSVGKSCLAMRLVEDRYPNEDEHGTTHGMRFWPMAPEKLHPSAIPPEGERRDIVLWDLGGQDEYQLVHQLFLAETTLALVLIDPTRGRKAFEDAEAWITRLDKQLKGKTCVKLLIGAKLDEPDSGLDHANIQSLCGKCDFAGFLETSALNGRGAEELKEAIAKYIPWEDLGSTRRPELFQQIRDEIEGRRKRGDIVVYYSDLLTALGLGQLDKTLAECDATIKKYEEGGASFDEEQEAISTISKLEVELSAIRTVVDQLGRQGILVRSKVTPGDPVLVLQVPEIERYAGSIIIAAKQNPRIVPMVELSALMHQSFTFPRLGQRLERAQERVVLECTVQLLLEHGICFAHQGLLIFPSCFPEASDNTPAPLPYSVSLYYDFSGAINNVYASLVTSLVLAERFGGVRLWPDRAEFETGDSGLCGIRKIARPGGFAHMDLFFEEKTPDDRKALFTSFVEEHLREHDIEIQEHLAPITCECGNQIPEELMRGRIAMGRRDIVCPLCENHRYEIVESVTQSRERDETVAARTIALRTAVDNRRAKTTQDVVIAMSKSDDGKTMDTTTPIRLLHLSDLHFMDDVAPATKLQWLVSDITQNQKISALDYLVVSGDFTDKGVPDGFERALEFLGLLTKEFALTPERCLLVPGNHDVIDEDAFRLAMKKPASGDFVDKDGVFLLREAALYNTRFKTFADMLYDKFLLKPYPLDPAKQGMATFYPETGLQFLTFNSNWQIDRFRRKQGGINPDAVANAIREADQQVKTYGKPEQKLLRIGVWHHAVTGNEQMQNTEFLSNLQTSNVKLGLHGDIHQMERNLIGYWHPRKMHIVGSGSFASPAEGRPESTPRLYNLLEIQRDFTRVRVHTREQRRPSGTWDGWHEWDNPEGSGRLPYYDLDLT